MGGQGLVPLSRFSIEEHLAPFHLTEKRLFLLLQFSDQFPLKFSDLLDFAIMLIHVRTPNT